MYRFLASWIFLIFLKCGLAQEVTPGDTAYLSQVIIRSIPVADSLQNIPAAVAVLSRADLMGNNGALITAAMNKVPGVYMQQGALNTNRIAIRGIGARSQYGTDRVKAYINGIPISSATGVTVIEDIDPNILESVEVIKGPSSSIYGAGLGGAITLYTNIPAQNRVSLSSTMGSFGLLKNVLGLSLSGDKGSAQITYSRLTSDGYRDNSDYSRSMLTIEGALRLSEATELRLFSNLVRLNAQIPSSLNADDFADNPTTADRNWAASQGYESYDKLITGISLEHQLSSNFRNNTSIFGQFRNGFEPRPFNILDEKNLGLGARTKFNLKYPILGKSSELVFGAEYLHESYSASLFENLYRNFTGTGSVQGELLNSNVQNRSYINLFAGQQWRPFSKLLIDLGLNVNSTSYELNDNFEADSIDQSGSYRFPVIASPRVGASYNIGRSQNIYASIGKGFSTPSVEETLTPEGAINTGLLPESGWNFELGLKSSWLGGKLFAELALFTILIDDLLVAQRVGQDQFVGINAGNTQHNGAELSLQYKAFVFEKILIKPHFNAAINDFTFQDFSDDGENYAGNDLTGVPDHTFNLGFESEFLSGFNFRINLLNVGSIPLNDANELYSEPYNLLNCKVGYSLTFFNTLEASFFLGVNNILDQNYAASILPNAVGFGQATPRYYYPGDGRNFYGGVRVIWEY